MVIKPYTTIQSLAAFDYQRVTTQFQASSAASFPLQKGNHLNLLLHIMLYQIDYSSTILPVVVFSATLEFDIPINYHSEHG